MVDCTSLENWRARKGPVSSNLTSSAKIRNSNFRQKYGRREAPSVLHSPHKILILQGFATLRVAPRLPIQFQFYE